MCGIAAAYSFAKDLHNAPLSEFINSLEHRGPDGKGEFKSNQCWLGHTRLSIIGLGDTGAQPMTKRCKKDLKLTITFNGEIYNYIEVRERLKSLGHKFDSNSDTEVALRAYAEWGNCFEEKLNGIWAMAIFDHKKNELFLTRDRFGVKPLYIYARKSKIYFASELKAFRYLPGEDQIKIDQSFIKLLGKRSHGKEFILQKGISRFSAGHSLVIRPSGEVKIKQWWKTSKYIEKIETNNHQEIVNSFRDIFESALNLRLISDTKTCTALSGGIDSSAVLSYIHGRKLLDESRLRSHKAFTLDFELANKSEKHYAVQIANKYSIDHSIINCLEYINKNLPEIVEKTVYHSEQYGNLMIGPYLLYKSMSDEGYKVSVDGHGADELLGGYGKFMNDSLFDALILDNDENEYTQLRDTWERFGMHVNSREELLASFSSLLKRKPSVKLTSQFFAHRYQEFHDTTLPWILDTYDKIPMANGVEVRSPFLDWRLVAFSFGIPRSSLLRDGLTKKVLRDAVKDYLPIKVFNRTKKLGFGSPLKELLKKPQMVELIIDNCMSSDFINFSNFDGSKISADILKAIDASDFCKLVDLWPYVQLHILVSSLKRIQSV